MKLKLKHEGGITLIALIITIIILVILAAVSINTIYNMGIVEKGTHGVQQYSQKAVEENQMMGSVAGLIESTVSKIQDIIKEGANDKLTNLTGTTWRFSETTTWNDLYDLDLFNAITETYPGYGRMYFNFTSRVKITRPLTDNEIMLYAQSMTGETSGEAYEQAVAYLSTIKAGDEGYISCKDLLIPDGITGVDWGYSVTDYDQIGYIVFSVSDFDENNHHAWLKLPSDYQGFYGTILDESSFDIEITGGQDATNPALINWFKSKAARVK